MKTAILALLSLALLSGCASSGRWPKRRATVRPATPQEITATHKGLAEINEALKGVVFTSP